MPNFKLEWGHDQANFESRYKPSGKWQNNGHLDIYGLP
jgi:hypothetical protein